MNTQKVSFIKSAAAKKDFLRDDRAMFAFAGRSNVGKSSVINCILERKNFARVGNTPGKTLQVNYFLVDSVYFVDLPGYGYAKVSAEEKKRWGVLMEDYFAESDRITMGILIVDSRHAPTADDKVMADYFYNKQRPFCVVANKVDKLKKSEIAPSLLQIRKTLDLSDEIKVIPFSAVSKEGRRDLLGTIALFT